MVFVVFLMLDTIFKGIWSEVISTFLPDLIEMKCYCMQEWCLIDCDGTFSQNGHITLAEWPLLKSPWFMILHYLLVDSRNGFRACEKHWIN